MTSLEHLQKKHERLINLVRRMRGAQREYVKYYARDDLLRMQRLQREVDRIIDEEVKIIRSQQKELKF